MRTNLFKKAGYLIETKQVKVTNEGEYSMSFDVGKYFVHAQYHNHRLRWSCDCMAGSQENQCAHIIAAQNYLIHNPKLRGDDVPGLSSATKEKVGSKASIPDGTTCKPQTRGMSTIVTNGEVGEGTSPTSISLGLIFLTERQKQVLKELVEFTCEDCLKKEGEFRKNGTVVKLEIHRMIRGAEGGKYIPRNIKVICDECHDDYDYL